MTDFAVKTGTPVAAPVLVPTLQLTPAELGALGRVVAAAQAGVPAAAEDVLLVGPTLRGMGMYADKLVAARASGQAVGTGYANPTLYVSPAHAGRLAHLFQRVALNQTVSDEHRRSAEQVGPALQQLVELNPGSGAGQVLGPMAGALEGQDVRKGLLPAAAQLAAWMQEALPVSQARTVLDRAQLDALADVLTNSFSIQRAPGDGGRPTGRDSTPEQPAGFPAGCEGRGGISGPGRKQRPGKGAVRHLAPRRGRASELAEPVTRKR
jgi:hypothetical protein